MAPKLLCWLSLFTCTIHSLRFGLNSFSSLRKTFAVSRTRRRTIFALQAKEQKVKLSGSYYNSLQQGDLKSNTMINKRPLSKTKRVRSIVKYRFQDSDDDNDRIVKSRMSSSFRKFFRKDVDISSSQYSQSEKILDDVKISHLFDDTVDNEKENIEVERNRNMLSNEITEISKKVVNSVHELREAIINENYKLEDIEVETVQNKTNSDLPTFLNHEVLKVIEYRARTNSKPGKRAANDTDILALSIEGGGMRGAVSAGMASAIAILGLCDTFDSVYGSSAGSVIGAYMISRQMCVDVYTDVLPLARSRFVSKLRLASSLMLSVVDNALSTRSKRNFDLLSRQSPAMNISFVLDGIMDPKTGLRPLDIPSFRANDKRQPLRVVSSAVHNGEMKTFCFGSKEGDFFRSDHQSLNRDSLPTISSDYSREGVFACLQASMTVPGATGPPVNLNRHIHRKDSKLKKVTFTNETSSCFDAFCFEPLPYRSAVEEGATHVLVLRSRPDGCVIKTKPGVYEKTVSPMYFNKNGFPQVAEYFKQGGQQYRYLEDVMTLDEGQRNINVEKSEGVKVPPTQIYYGSTNRKSKTKVNMHNWNTAHLLPVTVPNNKKELPTLENGKDEVLQAVRDGFSSAFELLAPATGLDLDSDLTGDRVAELIFPKRELLEELLNEPVLVQGDLISDENEGEITTAMNAARTERKRDRILFWIKNLLALKKIMIKRKFSHESVHDTVEESSIEKFPVITDPSPFLPLSIGVKDDDRPKQEDALKLLSCLPGIKAGKFSPLSSGLQSTAGFDNYWNY